MTVFRPKIREFLNSYFKFTFLASPLYRPKVVPLSEMVHEGRCFGTTFVPSVVDKIIS